ncbi:MAG: hypothetical protein R3332_08990 [Pseudohongiellaceae bacterium]|nr:hypothetical protein [Pseudohongiellaceae bacterium]
MTKPIRELKRITTEYVGSEDRFRLTGQLSEEEVVEVWLTQRLLLKLLPHHLNWLEKQSDSSLPKEIVQSFAQQAAKAKLKKEAPVTSKPETVSWIAHAVDLAPGDKAFQMAFKGKEDAAALRLNPTQLRQWLNIVRQIWQQASWPMDIWPEWMETSDSDKSNDNRAVH